MSGVTGATVLPGPDGGKRRAMPGDPGRPRAGWATASRCARLSSMSMVPARLLEEALQLPDGQRADLAAELLASLAPATPAETRTDAEWLTTIERRARAALGGSPGIPWDQARQEIERRVHKARR